MLYAAGVPDEKAMQESPHVGIASVWWEGNPCKYGIVNYTQTRDRANETQQHTL
jgi:dihydroxy-acid dehydratase